MRRRAGGYRLTILLGLSFPSLACNPLLPNLCTPPALSASPLVRALSHQETDTEGVWGLPSTNSCLASQSPATFSPPWGKISVPRHLCSLSYMTALTSGLSYKEEEERPA
ncbi:hypothetical protein PAL_GLEAN10005038 [Pteropus alecto]|uniref:Uncharacterized protein n=1 Tax=Pteropus alecto TaxID=9402 RepID=L5L5F9_PTEAL|nr:hypothetical protein PAL_GLEAN10005038 [Pteropus alecto]